MSSIAQSLCTFSAELYSDVVKSQKDKLCNTLMSPLSVYSAMAMVLAGSRGRTRDELLRAMQLPNSLSQEEVNKTIGSVLKYYFKSEGGTEVDIANKMYAEKTFVVKSDYKKAMVEYFGADCENVDIISDGPGVRDLIHKWISKQTRDKIKEVIPEGEPSQEAVMLLVNALYFKGQWEHAFMKNSTEEMDFHLLDGSKTSVPMMFNNCDFNFAVLPNEKAGALKMPFLKSKWEMIIVLPDEPTGLPSLLSSLENAENLQKILQATYYSGKVDLYLPRFKLEPVGSLDMVPHLRHLGVDAVFTHGVADLSGVSDLTEIFLSKVWHKAMLEVDEEGATAAAVTVGGFALQCRRLPMEFKVSHPFVVVLVYNGEIPVFIGHVCDPRS